MHKIFAWILTILILTTAVLAASMYLGVFKQHRDILKVCGGAYYLEFVQTNPFGNDEVYLTDSSTFRYFIGKVEGKFESYGVECKGDDIAIQQPLAWNGCERIIAIDHQ